MKKYEVIVKTWFDETFGNTYHSVLIIEIETNKEVGYREFEYGYGTQYEQTAAEMLGLSVLETRKLSRFDVTEVCKKYQMKHR